MADQEKSLNITWSQFEVCNPDTRAAFENMCRFLFNAFFFDGKGLFHSDPNNPGIEIVPILHEESGQRISFQAKYFSTIDYSQIKHSAEKAIQYYSDELDAIYLYCNKDLTTSSKSYQDIYNLLSAHNISLVPITNQAILDQVLSNDTVSWHYFDYRHLTPKWFEERLQLSLAALGPRYNGDFNVNTGTENQLDIFLCDSNAVNQINDTKKGIIEQLKDLHYKHANWKKSLQRIISAILSIDDVSRATVTDCLSWPEILKQQCGDELSFIRELIIEKEKLYMAAGGAHNPQLRRDLSREIPDLENLIDILDNVGLDLISRTLLQEKVLIIKGEAGVGKSQLLANAAEKLNKEGQYALLMLGGSFLSLEPIATQITQQLEVDFNFQALLHKLEILGAQANCYTFLLIDAINESPYRDIWKTGLPSLIAQINKFEHIKIVISVRSGYERLVFNDSIIDGIEANKISNIVHSGFREESIEATLTFLNYYGIPFLPSYFLQAEMTNPLFLTLFCKHYTGENFDMFTLFEQLINRADMEAQKAVGITVFVPILQHLVEELAEIRLAKENWDITKPELFGLRFWDAYGLSSQKILFIAALERSGLLNNIIASDTESYYLGYNLLEDFVCAKQIFKRYHDKSALLSYIQDDLLKIEQGQIKNYFNIDIFIVICSLYADYYHEECFTTIFALVTDESDQNDISDRYIKSFLWRKASAINSSDFITYVNEHGAPRSSVLRVLVENSTKENHPLNALFLHTILENKPIAQRDCFWTTYINDLANREERLFQLVTYFDEGNLLNGLSESNTELLLILFTWLLTSSNRMLRDKASKASIELLKRNFCLCKPLLQYFEEVNDPYVTQRLFGIVFGATVKRCEPAMDTYRELTEYVYNFIFNQEIVYPDILLRDYARLILERWIYEAPADCDFIDVTKIRPPYRSAEIPHVESQDYFNEENIHSGFNSIDFSMRINHSECPGTYGDFGRYTFQAALERFETVDVVNLYHYAMQYIRDTLGYSDQLFGDYDRFRVQRNYSRHQNKKIERIGKKYQWIAFYNILARVSDTHLLKDWNVAPYPYEGAWEPYVRDFDPTLNINFLKPNFLPVIQYPQSEGNIFLQTAPFPSETEVQKWTKQPSNFFESLPNKLLLVDSDGTQWVSLNLYDNFKSKNFESSSIGFSKGSQEIWLTAHGYFVEPETFEILKKQIAPGAFYTDFPRGLEVYQLFNREYSWSPGYQSIFQPSCFESEIEIGEKILIKETVNLPALTYTEDGDFEFKVTEQEIERLVPDGVIPVKVTPAYSHLLWEEEYDASQEDATSFDIPCREIIEHLHLEQKEYDGYYFNSVGELICFDASLSGICDGLLIRKDYLEQFLTATGLRLFWLCTGEKQFFRGELNQIWKRWEGFIYYNQSQIYGSIEPVEEN
ncbi:MAG: hypothetical protein HFH37_13580 [Lachnospiraceae bacterium]|nr:hypothetical protein [Lachnospiraceae bacterium]